jgi:hypothetical protein
MDQSNNSLDTFIHLTEEQTKQVYEAAAHRMKLAKESPKLKNHNNDFSNHLCGAYGEFACKEFATRNSFEVTADYSNSIFGRIDLTIGSGEATREISVKTTERLDEKRLYPEAQLWCLLPTVIVVWCYAAHDIGVWERREPTDKLPRNSAVRLNGWSHATEVKDGVTVEETYRRNGKEKTVMFRSPTTVHPMTELLALLKTSTPGDSPPKSDEHADPATK